MGVRRHDLDSAVRTCWFTALAVVGVGLIVTAPLAVVSRGPAAITAVAFLGVGAIALAVTYPFHRRLVRRLLASEERSRVAANEQAALRRVASGIAAEAAPDVTFAQIARESGELLDADAGLVVRFRRMEAVTEGWWSRRQSGMADRFTLDGQGALAQVHRGAGARVDDYRHLPGDDEIAEVAHRAGYTSSIAAPFCAEGALWGAVLAARCDGAFPPRVEERLRHFAELAGIAVANAEARSALASQAATDPLTRLANHRVFHERLSAEVDRAFRHGRSLALIVIDLDHFKRVNDIHGHRVGDDVLRTVGGVLTAQSRSGETVARIGGEELAWILPETDSLGAWQAAERARRAIAGAFPGTAHPITASAGVCDLAQISRPGAAAELFERADTALYWAKTHGRDVCFRHTREVAEALAERGAHEGTEGPGDVMVPSSAAVRALAQALDSVDPPTLLHCGRVAMIASQLAIAVGWTRPRAALLRDAATLHDIGKIAASAIGPPSDGRPSPDDRDAHVEASARIVSSVMSSEQTAWVRHHHERWDGSGRPDGLRGEDIPAGARILAVADAWDSLTAQRSPGRGRDGDHAIAILEGEIGTGLWGPAVSALATLWRSGTILGSVAAADADGRPPTA